MMKIDTFDTNFKSDSSSIGNVECLLGIELTSRLYKRVCWALNSHPPSMNYRRLITALGFRHNVACLHPFLSLRSLAGVISVRSLPVMGIISHAFTAIFGIISRAFCSLELNV